MITEIAILTVRAGTEPDFAAAYLEAVKNIVAAKGYRSHSLARSIETPNRFLLSVQWDTLEDHTVGFRGSAEFKQWRALIAPFFDAPPVVEHFR